MKDIVIKGFAGETEEDTVKFESKEECIDTTIDKAEDNVQEIIKKVKNWIDDPDNMMKIAYITYGVVISFFAVITFGTARFFHLSNTKAKLEVKALKRAMKS